MRLRHMLFMIGLLHATRRHMEREAFVLKLLERLLTRADAIGVVA